MQDHGLRTPFTCLQQQTTELSVAAIASALQLPGMEVTRLVHSTDSRPYSTARSRVIMITSILNHMDNSLINTLTDTLKIHDLMSAINRSLSRRQSPDLRPNVSAENWRAVITAKFSQPKSS